MLSTLELACWSPFSLLARSLARSHLFVTTDYPTLRGSEPKSRNGQVQLSRYNTVTNQPPVRVVLRGVLRTATPLLVHMRPCTGVTTFSLNGIHWGSSIVPCCCMPLCAGRKGPATRELPQFLLAEQSQCKGCAMDMFPYLRVNLSRPFKNRIAMSLDHTERLSTRGRKAGIAARSTLLELTANPGCFRCNRQPRICCGKVCIG